MSKLDALLAAVTARAEKLTEVAQVASVVNERIASATAAPREGVKQIRKGRKNLTDALLIGDDPAGFEARRTAAAAAPAGSLEKQLFALDRRIADAKAAAAYASAMWPAEPEPEPTPEPEPEPTKKKK